MSATDAYNKALTLPIALVISHGLRAKRSDTRGVSHFKLSPKYLWLPRLFELNPLVAAIGCWCARLL